MKEYTVADFLEHAAEYLKIKPLDMVKASEKVSSIILLKSTYLDISLFLNHFSDLGMRGPSGKELLRENWCWDALTQCNKNPW